MSHYPVTVHDTDFRIAAAARTGALVALRSLAPTGTLRFYPTVETSASLDNAPTLVAALRACGWGSCVDECGAIADVWLEGDDLGDSEAMFSALVQYVRPGSYIEFVGADGDIWRWTFCGDHLRESYPEMVWPSSQQDLSAGWRVRASRRLRRLARLGSARS